MPRISAQGAASVSAMGNPNGNSAKLFDFSTPAGWTMFWWILSVIIILGMFIML